ncbi:uncharacterized protein LOC107647346 [Arachis ipaensis]|uniref:uncharacterized protein LOC107647346 n=1 Tax=Arachis ipaensis TaxID=130454 RepID=UPI0007AF7CDE|nr:uncharacterized protein LOC107647346 [Arachis ipaensis]
MISSLQLLSSGSECFDDAKLYGSVVGTLQYLCITRPDISFAVSKVSQFMHSPLLSHWKAVKRILSYLQGTKEHGLLIHPSSDYRLYGFANTDWAADLEDRRSISGYCVFLEPNLVTWCCRKQTTISRSSTEAEFRSLAACEGELVWLTNLLTELKIPMKTIPTIFCDNLSIVLLTTNPVQHNRTKHFQLDVQIIREKLKANSLHVIHIPGHEQVADILPRPLSATAFQRLKDKLRVIQRPHSSLRGAVEAGKEAQGHGLIKKVQEIVKS